MLTVVERVFWIQTKKIKKSNNIFKSIREHDDKNDYSICVYNYIFWYHLITKRKERWLNFKLKECSLCEVFFILIINATTNDKGQ